jgi:hypothetical protein
MLWPLVGFAALLLFLAAAVFPTRTYLQQRDQMAAEQEKVQILTAENQKLAARVTELHTDAEIERLAREQYNLVKPGEEAYAILPGPDDPEPEIANPSPAPPPVPDRSLWTKVEDALTFWD